MYRRRGLYLSEIEICLEQLVKRGEVKLIMHKDGESYWNSRDICLPPPYKPAFTIQQVHLLYPSFTGNLARLEEVDFHQEKILEAVETGQNVDLRFITKFLLEHYRINAIDTEICLRHLLACEILIGVYYDGSILYKQSRDENLFYDKRINNPLVSYVLKHTLSDLDVEEGHRTYTHFEISRAMRMFISSALRTEELISEGQMPQELSGDGLILSLNREALYGNIAKFCIDSYAFQGTNRTTIRDRQINSNSYGRRTNQFSTRSSPAIPMDTCDIMSQGQISIPAVTLQASTPFLVDQQSHISPVPTIIHNHFYLIPGLNPHNSYAFHDGVFYQYLMQPPLQTVGEVYIEQLPVVESNQFQSNVICDGTEVNELGEADIPPTCQIANATNGVSLQQYQGQNVENEGFSEGSAVESNQGCISAATPTNLPLNEADAYDQNGHSSQSLNKENLPQNAENDDEVWEFLEDLAKNYHPQENGRETN
nr:histone acetyltransferase myst3 [Hymenolepis microstoma]